MCDNEYFSLLHSPRKRLGRGWGHCVAVESDEVQIQSFSWDWFSHVLQQAGGCFLIRNI